MTRDEAFLILNKYLNNPNLIKHCLACEASMKALYKRLTPQNKFDKKEEEKWGIVGLLHDADYQLSEGTPEIHGLILFEHEKKIPEDIAHAIKSHNYKNTKIAPQSSMDWGITCIDQLTGLIVAATLVHPSKNLKNVDVDFVINRMNDASFARGAEREPIKLCEEKLGIPLPEFIALVLFAMQSIRAELGLDNIVINR